MALLSAIMHDQPSRSPFIRVSFFFVFRALASFSAHGGVHSKGIGASLLLVEVFKQHRRLGMPYCQHGFNFVRREHARHPACRVANLF